MKQGLSQEELDRFKPLIEGSFNAALSDDLTTTHVYGSNELAGLDIQDVIHFQRTFEQITLEYTNSLLPSWLPESGVSIGTFTQ
ncbi:hypothetical protein [Veronia nyctiphanis]|uniref:hypothetical protein n=1 Tax=Veronia nyctiphanis TaxID=1278244 RepID=UPI0013759AD4|nr:hypothetical protein [Veronia nyctiphanis]